VTVDPIESSIEEFNRLFREVWNSPPSNDGDPNGAYAHRHLGRHNGFFGSLTRPYRRGKARCLYCGAPMSWPDGLPDPHRFMTNRERLIESFFTPHPFWKHVKENDDGPRHQA